MLITDLPDLYAARMPQKPCLVTRQGAITYHELYKAINQTANALLSSQTGGLHAGKTVALLLDNVPELLQIFLAAAKIGWLSLIFDPKWTTQDITNVLAESKPDLFF